MKDILEKPIPKVGHYITLPSFGTIINLDKISYIISTSTARKIYFGADSSYSIGKEDYEYLIKYLNLIDTSV